MRLTALIFPLVVLGACIHALPVRLRLSTDGFGLGVHFLCNNTRSNDTHQHSHFHIYCNETTLCTKIIDEMITTRLAALEPPQPPPQISDFYHRPPPQLAERRPYY